MSEFVKQSDLIRQLVSRFSISKDTARRRLLESRLLKPVRLGPKSIRFRRRDVEKVMAGFESEAA